MRLIEAEKLFMESGVDVKQLPLVPWSAPLLRAVPLWSTKVPGPAVRIVLRAPDSDR